MKLVDEPLGCPTCGSTYLFPDEHEVKNLNQETPIEGYRDIRTVFEVRYECHDCAEVFDFALNVAFGRTTITSTRVGITLGIEELDKESARNNLRDSLDKAVRQAFPDDRFSVVLKERNRD